VIYQAVNRMNSPRQGRAVTAAISSTQLGRWVTSERSSRRRRLTTDIYSREDINQAYFLQSRLLIPSYAILNHVRKISWFLSLILIFLALGGLKAPAPAAAQETIPPSILMLSPREGQALLGVEIIEGRIRGDGFRFGTVRFSYAGGSLGDRTWFFVADIQPEVQDSAQTSFRIEWDTTQLTDGNYDLRIVAEYEGGSAIFELIPNLRVRNYSPVESSTPAPVQAGTTQEFTPAATSTALPRSTPTPLPSNPAVVDSEQLYGALRVSAIVVAGFFFLGMIYWYLRKRRD
jgi:hypothetical protein